MKGNFWWGVLVGAGGYYAYHRFRAGSMKKG